MGKKLNFKQMFDSSFLESTTFKRRITIYYHLRKTWMLTKHRSLPSA